MRLNKVYIIMKICKISISMVIFLTFLLNTNVCALRPPLMFNRHENKVAILTAQELRKFRNIALNIKRDIHGINSSALVLSARDVDFETLELVDNMLFAVYNGKTIGYLTYGVYGKEAHINTMAVHEEYRKLNIGINLVARAFEEALKQKSETMKVIAYDGDDVAVRFWETTVGRHFQVLTPGGKMKATGHRDDWDIFEEMEITYSITEPIRGIPFMELKVGPKRTIATHVATRRSL